MKTPTQLANQLIKKCLQEAVPGSITAEKMPGGGDAGGGKWSSGEGEAGSGGGESEEPPKKNLTVVCGDEECEAVIQALTALKSAGANLTCTCDGEECNLDGEPEEPDGTPEHEAAETPAHEKAEHAFGHEKPDELETDK